MSVLSYQCLIAVSEFGESILVESHPSVLDTNMFDGPHLSDNITRIDTIPTGVGIYQCTIKAEYTSIYDHYSGGYEYDSDVWIENPLKIKT